MTENQITRKLSDFMQNDDIFFEAEIRIGPFKLLDPIGKGKFATVFLGIHEETKEKVAIKKIKKSELNTDNLLSKEINIQKILFHPYLVKMYCVIEKDENIYIITEYCSKGDIFNYIIEHEKFNESQSCKYFQQILSSLEYLHKNNICHRDIKPENILLDEYDNVKLSDFGLSKKFEKNELLNTACGSPLYAAPEMLLGKPYKGTNIDVWSLGVSLYIMVCGDFPFDVEDGNDQKALIYKIIQGKYIIPDFVSPLLKDLIQRILEIDPDKRITIDEIKEHKWVNNFGFNYMKSPGVILDEYFLPIDIYLIKEINEENENEIRKMINDILMNKHNNNTINYYLKNEIKKRKGENSMSDLRVESELFLEYINNERSRKSYWGNNTKKIEDDYMNQVMNLFKLEKIKENKIKKEIKDYLKNSNIVITNEQENKKNQMIKFKTDLKFSINTDIKEKKEDNKITKIKEENKEEGPPPENNKKKNLEIINQYIGLLVFIHDLLDSIITKVVITESEKNKISNYMDTPYINMEIKQSEQIKTTENNLEFEGLEKIERKLSFKNQDQLTIKKEQTIELVSTPSKIMKNSFSFINKVQSENIEINSIKKTGRTKRSESCHFRNKKNNLNKNLKDKKLIQNKSNKNNQSNKNFLENKKENKSKIIKSIDLNSKGFYNKKNSSKKKNKSNSNIKHLQINIIKNEIIIANNSYYDKDNLKNNRETGLIKNYSQNYSFEANKSVNTDSKILKKKLLNNTKIKNRNKIPVSKFHNKSVDLKCQDQEKNNNPINIKKNKNYLNIKKDLLLTNKKNNINKFLKTPNSREKGNIPPSTNIRPLYSPNPKQGLVKNIFINKKYNDLSNIKKEMNQLQSRKNKKIALINNNLKKDFIEFNTISNKYYNNYIKSKKYEERTNQHNSQLISLFSQPNEKEEDKKINNYGNNNSKSRSKEKISSKNYKQKSIKTEITPNNSQNKRKQKNNKNLDISFNNEKGDDKLIKTKLSLDQIKQIIKKYVGNNVVENRDNGNFKFICKTKCDKDDLIFHLELISKSYDSLTLKGTLVKGETKFYKELIFKIRERIN